MATTELQPGKLFYSISEVAGILGEKVSLVRFWTDYFPKFVKAKRTRNKNNRIYDEAAVKNLQLIHYLVKEQGMTLEGAARRLEENKEGLDNRFEVITKLQGIRAELQQIYESM
ncbi:MAG: MerR family transcriptional regulator [Bacteroidales bacterium]|nr:MerR family transcriptional regulator [Bacteroidales bacterium]